MKKILTIVSFAVLIIGIAGSAFAATSTASLNQNKSAIKSKLTEERAFKINNSISGIKNRFDVLVGNLDSLSQRIQSWINKMSQEGKNTTVAQTKLAEANIDIQQAKDAVAGLKQEIEGVIAAANPRKALVAVRTTLSKNVMTKIKIAHKALVDTVVILKGIAEVPHENSTSTSGTSISQ